MWRARDALTRACRPARGRARTPYALPPVVPWPSGRVPKNLVFGIGYARARGGSRRLEVVGGVRPEVGYAAGQRVGTDCLAQGSNCLGIGTLPKMSSGDLVSGRQERCQSRSGAGQVVDRCLACEKLTASLQKTCPGGVAESRTRRPPNGVESAFGCGDEVLSGRCCISYAPQRRKGGAELIEIQSAIGFGASCFSIRIDRELGL